MDESRFWADTSIQGNTISSFVPTIVDSMMDAKRIQKVATALSDGHRITIFLEVAKRGTIPYKEMAALTALSQPAFSHHIKILAESGLLKTQKTGRAVGLSLNEHLLKQVSAFFLHLMQSVA